MATPPHLTVPNPLFAPPALAAGATTSSSTQPSLPPHLGAAALLPPNKLVDAADHPPPPPPPGLLPPSSASDVPTLQAPDGRPAQGLPGYATVRDDFDLDVFALFFAEGGTTTVTAKQEEREEEREAPVPAQPPAPVISCVAEQTRAAMYSLTSPPSVVSPELAPAELRLHPNDVAPQQLQRWLPQPPSQVSQPPPGRPHAIYQPPPQQQQQQQQKARHPNPSPAPPSPQMSGMSAADIVALSKRNFVPKVKKNSLPAAAAVSRAGKKRGSPSSTTQGVGGRRPAKGLKATPKTTAASSSASRMSQSPHSYLLAILRERGYPSSIHKSRDCGYKSPTPTSLQLASYGTAVLRAAQRRDISSLSALIQSGLSRNPCNRFSESVLDMSAKRGFADVFACLVEAGADVQTADDFGRTPLHHAAWSGVPSFEIAERLLGEDPDMVRLADDRGKAPLEYVRADKWEAWIEFLEARRDHFWPARDGGRAPPPEEAKPRPKRRVSRIPDPEDALHIKVATLVASGRLDPATAKAMQPGDPLPPAQEPAQPAQGFKFPSMLAAVGGGKSAHNTFLPKSSP